ncbi:glycosyltransferase [Streptomyces sp. RO-S4]|uniref:glycosyltransferase n=1 Tax=Streptomyces sp. RO-S4 TaxID=2902486 RepID=UPI0035AFEF51
MARAAGRLPPGRAHRIPPGRSSPGAHRIRQHGGRARRAARRTGDRPGEAGRRPCGADPHGHGPDVLTIVPHDWPFPRTAAVVHHAGAGTTAAGLRAGLPAVPVPVMADQPFCASRLHALGVAQRPVPFREPTAGGLGDAITACLSEPSHRRRAAGLARGIATEDGAATLLAHNRVDGSPVTPLRRCRGACRGTERAFSPAAPAV